VSPEELDRMMWAVGARYGYDTMKLRAHHLAFYYAGHVHMNAEESGGNP
jgi:hypothetical protein